MSARDMAHKVVTFPPFIALVVAVLLSPVAFPPVLNEALARIGDTLAPLALLSVGMQLRFDALREEGHLLCMGLCYKLLICPALVITLLWLLDVEASPASSVSVIEAAMPPMIGAAVVATQYNLAPRLTSMLVGIGIPLGLFTASAWFWLFGAITR
jgi:predicted permease